MTLTFEDGIEAAACLIEEFEEFEYLVHDHQSWVDGYATLEKLATRVRALKEALNA